MIKKRTKRPGFSTWSRGELMIADYLLEWAIQRTSKPWQVEAYVQRRADIRHAIESQDSAILSRFLQCKVPAPTEKGLHYDRLNRILARIIERQAF